MDQFNRTNKILQVASLNSIRQKFSEKKIIFVSGCFDILHIGHVEFMEEAKSQADILIIGVLSDKFVKQRKGHTRPIFTEDERVSLITSLQIVDYAFVLDSNDVGKVLESLQPDYYGIGGDRDKKNIPEKTWLDKYPVKIHYLSRFGSDSTTTILNRVLRNT